MAYFAIGLPIAILIRLFAGVPLFWIVVAFMIIFTIIGISQMDDEQIVSARKFKDGNSIDSLAMAKKYYEDYQRRDKFYNFAYLQNKEKYFWKDIRKETVMTVIHLKDGTEKYCAYVTWNERLQEIHLRSNYREDYEVVKYEDIASICVY